MFERFDERARQVVVLAQDEARTLKHNYIGTEHILLGLLREEEGVAACVLESLDIAIEEVRVQVARIIGQGDEVTTGQIPFTPRAKKILELALQEALALGHNHIGTEHLLLGLVREGEGVAIRVLLDFGADGDTIYEAVLRVVSGAGAPTPAYSPKSPPLAPEVVEELERVRTAKERAVEDQDFERAVELRERERRLRRAAEELERALSGEPPRYLPRPAFYGEHGTVSFPAVPVLSRPPLQFSDFVQFSDFGGTHTVLHVLVILGWVLFGAALGIGILVGWAIWG